MDRPPPAVAFTAFADAWPKAIETEIGTAYTPLGAGKDFDFCLFLFAILIYNDCYLLFVCYNNFIITPKRLSKETGLDAPNTRPSTI